jgi:signal transduction histidine kinase
METKSDQLIDPHSGISREFEIPFFRVGNTYSMDRALKSKYGHRAQRIAVFLLAWLGFVSCVRAQSQRISQMVHTIWTGRDGAPENINTLAQTTDGMLWLGARDGLYQFDGISFAPFYPTAGILPRKNVEEIVTTPEGDLWVVAPGLPPTRIRQGIATVFDRVDRERAVFFGDLQRSLDGTMWALLNKNRLVRLEKDGVWHTMPGPKSEANVLGPLFIDSSGTQWLVADELLYKRFVGENNFAATNIAVYDGAKFGAGAVFDAKILEGKDESLWIVSSRPVGVRTKGLSEPGLIHVDRWGKPLPNARTSDDINDIVSGDGGSIWLSHSAGGLEQLGGSKTFESKTPPDLFTVEDGLVNEGDRSLLRDRDGNIWVAGTRGLEKFQDATLLPVLPKSKSGLWSVCVATSGDIWLSLFGNFTDVERGSHITRLNDNLVGALACGTDGKVRVFGNRGIGEIHEDRIDYLPLLPGRGAYWARYVFFGLAVLPGERLIASTIGSTENGLWSFQNGTWEPFVPNLHISAIQGMMADSHNNLYLGSNQGEITVLKAGSFDVLFRGRLGIGAISGFSETRYGVFALGQDGIALEQNQRFRKLYFANPDLATSVTGLVEDRGGNVWINGSRAIARIVASEITLATADLSHPLVAREFREGDFRGSDFFGYARNSAQIDAQGRLWFPTSNGVVSVNPQSIDRAFPPPSLSIRSITADGKSPDGRTFAARPQTLDIRYFGLNLSDPASVVYRYRLEGYERGWEDAGSRTEAMYTHLHPGKYVFEIAASNGDGTWTKPFDSLPFTVRPAFYETWWFAALCASGTIFLILVGLKWRLRAVSRVIQMRSEERADERIRIARELHDTLLQGVQGLLLSFHVAAEKVPPGHESKRVLEKALATADRVILEGRNRVNRLRSENLADAELKSLIEAVAAELDHTAQVQFAVERTGENFALRGHVVEEIFWIAREAVTNAFRHSEASQISIGLDYQKNQFRMACRDNGHGFDFVAFETNGNGKDGHWGIRGMEERAQNIGAKFCCDSGKEKGTEILVVVPARRAYVPVRGLSVSAAKTSAIKRR